MPKCPRCSGNAKLTGKEWEYGQFHVKQYECLGCEKKFMEYFRDGKLSHTIPKDGGPPKPRTINIRRRVLSYLMRNEYVSDEQIAKDLKLEKNDVQKVLLRLEKRGVVEKVEKS